MRVSQIINSIPEDEKTPTVLQLTEIIQLQSEQIQVLKDEIARLKGQKGRPDIKPSDLGRSKGKMPPDDTKIRPGSAKKDKTESVEIHKDEIIPPDEIPEGSRFKGYQDYAVQDLIFSPFNTRYRPARWETPDGRSIIGKLPDEITGSHFGIGLRSFILCQYYHAHVTRPVILEQLTDTGPDISSGRISRILIDNKELFHAEKEDILRVGPEVSCYLNVDDTGARHNGNNGCCTHTGNEYFACFESTGSKSRINFLKILRNGYTDCVVNADAVACMASQKFPQKHIRQLYELSEPVVADDEKWHSLPVRLEIRSPRHVQIATEGALIGSVIEHGLNPNIIIISDDAGQFNLFCHGLCRIHAERTISRLVGFNDGQRAALDEKRSQIWEYYEALKGYKENPAEALKPVPASRFDEIFKEKTCFAGLNPALERLHKNKNELLPVLEHPGIPLHNNLSENDIREYVKRRKISGSARSPTGRRCRDTFTGLKKTCRKLGISFWEYLRDRLGGAEKGVPYLPELIRSRASQVNQ